MTLSSEHTWLLLIHQLPPKPAYLRVKIGRRLQEIGAVAIKNTVYVLPKREESVEDFQWLLQEIQRDGGEAMVCNAEFVEGLTDAEIIRLFTAQIDASYGEVIRQARKLLHAIKADSVSQKRTRHETDRARLRKNMQRIAERDFFNANSGCTARSILDDIDQRLKIAATGKEHTMPVSRSNKPLRGRTWVTRANIFVDRMASAWLITRFIDPDARIKYVDVETYRHKGNEIRFDTYEGEFTHQGDRCTFEVLCDSFQLRDPALGEIGEIVHDIDMKDGKYARDEAAGVALALRSTRSACKTDVQRFKRAVEFFDELYEELKRTDGRKSSGSDKPRKRARTRKTR